MASSYIFDQVKRWAATKGLGINIYNSTDDTYSAPDGLFRIALATPGALDQSFSTYTKWSEISSYEITKISNFNDEGYPDSDTHPGSPLKDVVMSNTTDIDGDALIDSKISAKDVIYPVSTIDAGSAIVMRDDGNGDYDLIATLDLRVDDVFGSFVSSTSGVFSLILNSASGGFLIIK